MNEPTAFAAGTNLGSPLALATPVAIWFALVGFFSATLWAWRDGAQRLRQLHRIPCHRCKYYTGSWHLKCPVNPTAAFSEAALHCPDFDCDATPPRSLDRLAGSPTTPSPSKTPSLP